MDGEDGLDDEGTDGGAADGQLDPATRAAQVLWIRGGVATSCNLLWIAAGWRWIRSHRRRPRGLPNPALCPAATAAASAQGVGLGHRIARGRSEWGGAWRGVDGEGSDAGWFSACAAGDDMEQRGEDRWSGGG